MSTDAERAAIEKGWIYGEPPSDKTLIAVYEEAIFLQKACRKDSLKRMAYATPIVLVVATMFYGQWPWVGLVVLAVGILVIALFWIAYDLQYWSRRPRPPWQHSLYDGDFTRLSPAKIVFSRDSPRGIEVLIQKNGDYLQVSVSAPKSPERVLREGRTLNRSEFLTKVVSAVAREFDAVK